MKADIDAVGAQLPGPLLNCLRSIDLRLDKVEAGKTHIRERVACLGRLLKAPRVTVVLYSAV